VIIKSIKKVTITRKMQETVQGILHLFFRNFITGKSTKEKTIAKITGNNTEDNILQIKPNINIATKSNTK